MSDFATSASRAYRERLRTFRCAANDLCWITRFDDPPPAEEDLAPLISAIDDDIYSLLRVDGDDDILTLLTTSKEETVGSIDITDLIATVSSEIREVCNKYVDVISRVEPNLESEERDRLEKPQLKLVHFVDSKDLFARPKPLDLNHLIASIADILKDKIQFPMDKLEHMAEMYAAAYNLRSALEALRAFEVPARMSKNHKMVVDLKQKIAAMEKAAIDKKSMIRRLQEEKRNARTENISLKRESDLLHKRVEESTQLLAQAQQRAAIGPPLKAGLEQIAAILKEPARPRVQSVE
jgi:hypothetical protein